MTDDLAGQIRRDPDDMCPNCVTPWKCNGPHIRAEQQSCNGIFDPTCPKCARTTADGDHS